MSFSEINTSPPPENSWQSGMPGLSAGRTVNRALLEQAVLPHVLKPARYLGLEHGAFRKSFDEAAVTMCAVFPDLSEIGFSNYGLKLLYSLVNRLPNAMCDRAYAPAPDFKEQLAAQNIPLYGVESFVALRDFDVLAFSLQYELNYTTIFGILEAAQIPFRSTDRSGFLQQTGMSADGLSVTDDITNRAKTRNDRSKLPLIIAGGPGSANPMPLSPFIDVFIVGDGEEVLPEILDVVQTAKCEGIAKAELLIRLSRLQGLFIPGVTANASKRIVDIAENPVALAPLVPMVGAVHDRVTVEARRGCDRMCRFCQPCFINLPVREQSIENIKKSTLAEIEKTGYEECSLLSLSIADYSQFKPLILEVADALKGQNVSLSLPSQRADRFSLEVAEAVQSVRKSTLTFAPEAGTARMRNVINKNLSDDEIMNAVTSAYRAGWNKVKLYFIIGLPTETHEDLDGIVDTVRRLQRACESIKREPGVSLRNHLEVNVTLSNFVPKPHTPFQWFPQETMAQLAHKIDYLKTAFRGFRGVKLNFTDPEISKLESVISRGGAELADVIEAAYLNGAYLDAWDDRRNFEKWFEALSAHGIDHEAYTRERCIDPEGPLPWDCIDVGLDKAWLQGEYQRATEAAGTTPCFEECSTCGVCSSFATWPKFTPEIPSGEGALGSGFGEGVRGMLQRLPTQEALRMEYLQSGERTPSQDLKMEAENLPDHKKDAVCKARIKIEKKGPLRYISHLDWLRMLHRAASRAELPVAYSQGFNPKPKISFGPALPLFTESLGEYVDVELTTPMINVGERLNVYLPPDGQVLSETLVPIGTPSIDRSVRLVRYRANYSVDTTCEDPLARVKIMKRISFLKEQRALPVEVPATRKAKSRNAAHRHSEPQASGGLQAKQVLDLAPYLESLDVDRDGAVTFGIHWWISGKDVNSAIAAAGEVFKGQAGSSDAESVEMPSPSVMDDAEGLTFPRSTESEAGINQAPTSIKPAWLLNLIDPAARWALTRTDIELAPSAPYGGKQALTALTVV